MNDQNIKILNHNEIDTLKWDQCISNASNSNVYAKSWFLDILAEKWKAIIFEDYKYVMPLPVKKKIGIPFIYQPLYTQQLGIFPTPAPDIQKLFAEMLLNRFSLVHYQLNAKNNPEAFQDFKISKRNNLCLSLQPTYEEIRSGFARHTFRNIRTAEKNNIHLIKVLDPDVYIKGKLHSTVKKPKRKILIKLNSLITASIARGEGKIYAAYTQADKLCSAAFFLFDTNKIYYLNAFSTIEGRQLQAMYFIINELIKEHAGSDIILDFEGSMIDGVSWFYKGFGASPEKYFYIYSNKLPLFNKLLR